MNGKEELICLDNMKITSLFIPKTFDDGKDYQDIRKHKATCKKNRDKRKKRKRKKRRKK